VPIYTPRGLKIRLELPYAFALMARLHPRVSAFRVLRTTEAIESIPSSLSFICGMLAFLLRWSPAGIAAAVAAAYTCGVLINAAGFYVIPGVVSLGRVYSVIAGRGILVLAIGVTGYLTCGIWGLVGYAAGRGFGFLVRQIEEWRFASGAHKVLGQALTASERSFFNAYRVHSAPLGITTDISIDDGDLDEANWSPAYERLATEWPEVASRFKEG
jgi:hypothetical protein